METGSSCSDWGQCGSPENTLVLPDPDPLDVLVFLSVDPPGRNRFLSVVCADLRILESLAVHEKVGELISLADENAKIESAQKNHKNLSKF